MNPGALGALQNILGQHGSRRACFFAIRGMSTRPLPQNKPCDPEIRAPFDAPCLRFSGERRIFQAKEIFFQTKKREQKSYNPNQNNRHSHSFPSIIL
jgi:hypothetical protein